MAYIIWTAVCLLLVGIGIRTYRAEKPAGFFANIEAPRDIEDVKGYNHALGRLFIGYAVILCAGGLPLLQEKPGALVIVTMLVTVFATLAMMVLYTVWICPKYQKK